MTYTIPAETTAPSGPPVWMTQLAEPAPYAPQTGTPFAPPNPASTPSTSTNAVPARHDEQGDRVLEDVQRKVLEDLMDEYLGVDAKIKKLEEEKAEIKEDIERLLGADEYKGADAHGNTIAYTFPAPRKTLDKKAFEKAHPAISQAYNEAAKPFYKEGARTSRLSIQPPKPAKEEA